MDNPEPRVTRARAGNSEVRNHPIERRDKKIYQKLQDKRSIPRAAKPG